MEFHIFPSPYWGPLLVQIQRIRKNPTSTRTHLKSLISLWKSLHLPLHTEAHSWCRFSESVRIPTPTHTPEIYYFPMEFLTPPSLYWGPLLVQIQRIRKNPSTRTHLKSFIFLWNSLHSPSHTGAHSWCRFSEAVEIPAPAHT
jgi:hypothetical protein